MGWPAVLGLISYIAIIFCLTFWFTRHHFQNSRLWERKSQTENTDGPNDPTPDSHKSSRG